MKWLGFPVVLQEHVTEGHSLRNKNNLLALDFFLSVLLQACLSESLLRIMSKLWAVF